MSAVTKKTRILVAKPGLDGHDRGAKVLSIVLRDLGFEVIYTGVRQSPEDIATAAIQEGVDVVGLSCLSGAHMYLFPRVVEVLKEKGRGDLLVSGGGNIPPADVPELKKLGIAAIFGPKDSPQEIADYINKSVGAK